MKFWIIVQQVIFYPLFLSLSFTLTFIVLRFLFISGIIFASFLFITIMKWNIDSKLQLSNFILSYITSKQNFMNKTSNWEIWLIYYETWEKLMRNIMSLSYTLLDTCLLVFDKHERRLILYYSLYIAVIKLYWRVVSNQNFENKTSNWENMNWFIMKH
jgi:hypothetical protein